MTLDAYNRLRQNTHFLESLLTLLVLALFVLAICGVAGELLLALAVVIGGVLINLQRQHRNLANYNCPGCGELPHSRIDQATGQQHEPATPNCLHCGQPLTDQ